MITIGRIKNNKMPSATLDSRVDYDEPLKRKIGRAAAKYTWLGIKYGAMSLGKGVQYGVLKPVVFVAKDFWNRWYDVNPNETAIVIGRKGIFEDNFSRDQAMMSLESISPEMLYDTFPNLFSKKTKINPPKKRRFLEPGAYFRPYGTEVIKINTSTRQIDLDPIEVLGHIQGYPITFKIDLAISYEDDPIPFALKYHGDLKRIRKLRNSKEKHEEELADFRQGIEERIVSYAQNLATNHFTQNNSFIEASRSLFGTHAFPHSQRETQKEIGIKNLKFRVQQYIFEDEQKNKIYDLLDNLRSSAEKNQSPIEVFKQVVDNLSYLAGKSNMTKEFKYLMGNFQKYLETSRRNQSAFRPRITDNSQSNLN